MLIIMIIWLNFQLDFFYRCNLYKVDVGNKNLVTLFVISTNTTTLYSDKITDVTKKRICIKCLFF